MKAWIVLLGSLLSLVAHAQEEASPDQPDDPNWFRVELLVFSNDSAAARNSELWEPLPELTYPDRSMALATDTPPRMAADTIYELLPIESQLPPLFDLYWSESTEQLLWRYDWEQPTRQPVTTIEPVYELTVPVAFTPLPRSEQEFGAEHRRLDRSKDTRVLWHGAWLQPMRDADTATPLRLETAAIDSDFPELQGTVKLYVSRYLHIETNLWLNTNGDYLQSDWRMPAPPVSPIEEPLEISPFQLSVEADWLDVENTAEVSPEPAAIELAVAAKEESEDDAPADDAAPWSEADVEAFLAEPYYPFRHAVLVEQRRRMRSGELHYIDHPMLGLLIRIQRYEFEPFVNESQATDVAGSQ